MPLDRYDLTALAEEAQALEGKSDETSRHVRANCLEELGAYGHKPEDLLQAKPEPPPAGFSQP